MIELILYGVVMVIAMTMAGIIGFAANVIALRVSTWLVKRMNTTFFQQLVNVVLLFSALSLMSQVAQGVLG